MKQIKAEKLTREAFAPFGEYYDMLHPEGYSLDGAIHSFYPDRLTEAYYSRTAFSPIVVKKPERMIITQLEYHLNSSEIILPLTGDAIVHVGPASNGVPVTDLEKAFYVPKGTMVRLRAAVWHLAPLPVDDTLTALIVLPECTYANDCAVVDLDEADQFEVVL